MVQTPQQRRANEAYARSEAAKRGKAQPDVDRLLEKKKGGKVQKAPVSKIWLYLLLFVVCGGLIFEALRLVMGFFE
ncbi:hypothetical protein WHR41_02983 [Cladosporium halotolerans]|uniref:Stress-associated endoplasmic reticulum protein n=1 Tax=Cladosporium halotolerans TaxID=1052096 RepID=A0AB34KT74_9PEZI